MAETIGLASELKKERSLAARRLRHQQTLTEPALPLYTYIIQFVNA